MKFFAIAVFAFHTLAETAFGLRGFLTGTFSWQAGADMTEHLAQISVSARFLTAGLLSLAALGAWVLFGPGVQSQAGRAVSMILALFHLLGVLGVALSGAAHPDLFSLANTQGALAIHGLLGLGFLLVVVKR